MKFKHLLIAAGLSTGLLSAPTANAAIQDDLGITFNFANLYVSSLPKLQDFETALGKYSYSEIFGFYKGPSVNLGVSGFTFNWASVISFDTSEQVVYSNGNQITAVPGPTAGAGLGALAMGLGFYWVNRRRKNQASAA